MGLRHFLFTIPLGSLLITLFFYFIMPWANYQPDWHEAFAIIVGINLVVTVLAYLLIPPISIRRRAE